MEREPELEDGEPGKGGGRKRGGYGKVVVPLLRTKSRVRYEDLSKTFSGFWS